MNSADPALLRAARPDQRTGAQPRRAPHPIPPDTVTLLEGDQVGAAARVHPRRGRRTARRGSARPPPRTARTCGCGRQAKLAEVEARIADLDDDPREPREPPWTQAATTSPSAPTPSAVRCRSSRSPPAPRTDRNPLVALRDRHLVGAGAAACAVCCAAPDPRPPRPRGSRRRRHPCDVRLRRDRVRSGRRCRRRRRPADPAPHRASSRRLRCPQDRSGAARPHPGPRPILTTCHGPSIPEGRTVPRWVATSAIAMKTSRTARTR